MPGRTQTQVKPRIYTTRRGLDAVKFKSRPPSMYDTPNEGFTPHTNTDTTIGALTPGEYVLPRWLVQDIQAGRPPFPGETPEYMHGGEIPGYQSGGRVDESRLRRRTVTSQPRHSNFANEGRSAAPPPDAPDRVHGDSPVARNPNAPQVRTDPAQSGGYAPPPTSVAPGDRPRGETRAGSWQRTAASRSGGGTLAHTRRGMRAKLAPQYTGSGLWRGPTGGNRFGGPEARGRPESGYEKGIEEDYARAAEAARQAGYTSDEDRRRQEEWRQQQQLQHHADYADQQIGLQQAEIKRFNEGPVTSRSGLSTGEIEAAPDATSQASEFDFSGEAPEDRSAQLHWSPSHYAQAESDRLTAEAKADAQARADADAEADAEISEAEAEGDEHDAAANVALSQAQSAPVPQYEDEDFDREEAELDQAARKALGDAMRMAGEQASAMGLPVGTAQGLQAQVTADVSAKASIAKAQRFAQMRIQNMNNMMVQYDNKHKSLLFAAGLERDRAKSAQLYAQAMNMQSRGADIQKELLEYQDMLSTPTFWEGVLQIAGTATGVAGGAYIASKLCWVAEELFGKDDRRTHAARLWASTHDTPFTRLYKQHGREWAAWLKDNEWAKPLVSPLWEQIAKLGEEQAHGLLGAII